jgi:DNA modification methylase
MPRKTCRLLCGDALGWLRRLPDGCVSCCVTSPPYFGLRDYGHAGQIGLDATPDEYAARLVAVFREVRRVLRDDGTLWLNLGDSYASSGTPGPVSEKCSMQGGRGINPKHSGYAFGRAPTTQGLKPKDLIGIPWRVAFALQADGWWLRQDIVWSKPNPMPESVTDRCTKSHEYIFLLTKSARYFYDAAAIAEQSDPKQHEHNQKYARPYDNEARIAGGQPGNVNNVGIHSRPGNGTRNKRSVWTVSTTPYSGAHFATFPPEIPRRCILAGTSERGQCPACGKPWVRVTESERIKESDSPRYSGVSMRNDAEDGRFRTVNTTTGWQSQCECDAGDPVPQTVLDPFGGAGTTGMVADRLGRNAILIELNDEYATLARNRIHNDAPMFAEVTT